MHKERVRIHGCVIYWDGKSLCVHHPKEGAHHRAKSYEEAFAIIDELVSKHGVPAPESQNED